MVLRGALDKYHDDTGRYPTALEDLVTNKYIRKVPVDPISESDASWIVIPPADATKGAVYDIRSGAAGNSSTGTPYREF